MTQTFQSFQIAVGNSHGEELFSGRFADHRILHILSVKLESSTVHATIMSRRRFHGLKKIVSSLKSVACIVHAYESCRDFVRRFQSTIYSIYPDASQQRRRTGPSFNKNGRPKPRLEVIMARLSERSNGRECSEGASPLSCQWTIDT